MRLRLETKERIGVISGHNARLATRRIKIGRLLIDAYRVRLRTTRGRLEGAPTRVSSSDEGALSIALDYILCASDCANDARLEQKDAIAETAQQLNRMRHKQDRLALILKPLKRREALLLEARVSHRQNLVEKKNVERDLDGDRIRPSCPRS